ncbi:hypothetical protein B0H14DRAFT_3888044 [Mycena olivaceomarginata]|nr:hypothetical protein B0H14DRAFT_3888044 [Mycena olivaceomarginata]
MFQGAAKRMADAPSRVPGWMPSRAAWRMLNWLPRGSQVQPPPYTPLLDTPRAGLHPVDSLTGSQPARTYLSQVHRHRECSKARDAFARPPPALSSPSKPAPDSTPARSLRLRIENHSGACMMRWRWKWARRLLTRHLLSAAAASRSSPTRKRCAVDPAPVRKLKFSCTIATTPRSTQARFVLPIQARLYDAARARDVCTGSSHSLASHSFPPLLHSLSGSSSPSFSFAVLAWSPTPSYHPSLSCDVAASETPISMTRAHGRLLLARARAGADNSRRCVAERDPRAAHARVWRRLQMGSAPLQRLVSSSGVPRDHLPLTSLLPPCLPVVYNAVSQ